MFEIRISRVTLFILTLVFCGLSQISQAALGPAWRTAEFQLDATKRQVDVVLPEGSTRVALEVQNSKGRWVRWTTRKLPKGRETMGFRVPSRLVSSSWRAWAEVPGSLKFPAAFYKGKKNFAPARSQGYGETAPNTASPSGTPALVDGGAKLQLGDAKAEAKTEEADIWKSEGTTIFFFNQLRGLQVLDLSNPADPLLVCSLRLPAVGQDLYILPAIGDSRYILLLARDPADWDATVVYLAKIQGDSAEWVATKKYSGILADSRLKGNRLFLATQTWKNWQAIGQDHVVLREVVLDPANRSIIDGPSQEITGAWPVLSAGPDWMAVATSDWNEWNISNVSIFSLSESGLRRLNASPIRAAGRVQDKFKMQVREGVFSVFSEGWQSATDESGNSRSQLVTTLENFSVAGERLATLEIIRNERLFATRFAGDTAYAVTFEQVDPLWIIDLSNPDAPAITGHLEVPGWSTHIEPMGELLFSIGWDEGRVAASLFDVSDPAKPTLASRVFLSDSWGGFSESLYDEKALKILADENLALIPFSLHWSSSGETGHRIQLLGIDPVAKSLVPRGRIAHDFEPRRAAMVGSALASISQRQLVTADISNPDQPALLADLLLAWPVQRVIATGGHLLQIADGSTWWDAAPALRVSTISDPDTILAETPLGVGTVRDAVSREGKLFILRAEGSEKVIPMVTVRIGIFPPPASATTLTLDIFDVSDPLDPKPIRSISVTPGDGSAHWETGRLLFPSENSAVVLARQRAFYPWWGWIRPMPILVDDVAVAAPVARLSMPYDWTVGDPLKENSFAVVFDIAAGSTATVELPENTTLALDSASAAEGLVIFGTGDRLLDWSEPETKRSHHAGVLDVSAPTAPLLRNSIDLPGRLVAVSELDRRGFLAWTESGEVRNISASACNFQNAYLVATLPGSDGRTLAINGRSAFVARETGATGYRLADDATFRTTGTASLGWMPDSLRVLEGQLCAATYNRVAAVPAVSFPSGVRQWGTTTGVDLQNLVCPIKGQFAAPAGDYGVEIFK